MVSLHCELRRIGALRLWEERLQETDSVFARLVFVSQLRDASGRYVDPFLLRVFPARTCHRIVADAHRQVFREWLALSARTKLRDFQRYCDAICHRKGAGETAWTSLYRELVPSGISINELSLFSENTRRLVHMMCRRQEHVTQSSDHNASLSLVVTDE